MKKFFSYGIWQKILILFFILAELSAFVYFFYLLFSIGFQSSDIVISLIVYIAVMGGTEIFIVFTQSEPEYKMAWMVAVAALPFLGFVLFFLFANKRVTPRQKRRLVQMMQGLRLEASNPDTQARLISLSPDAKAISTYIERSTGGGIYENTEVTYYPFGQDAFPAMLEELKKAKHYIFLEYFILEDGRFWGEILEVLKEKALQGIDVRVVYDDMGNLSTLPVRYYETLRKYGIKSFVFRPIKPFLNVKMNNRDHRKIMVIDGHTGFTGGINLADEYINEKERFGIWKDNAVRLKGKAVFSLTLMFLSLWKSNFDESSSIDVFYYSPGRFIDDIGGFPHSDGFVQPYGDMPFDYAAVGQNVYLSIISRAKRYVYISTPYLIIDTEMKDALRRAALSGIDVRILTPHIPDKRTVFHLTRSYYGELIEAGVKVFEYTPGFVHQKAFVSDDIHAVIGTINLDYRSLYLHLENAVYIAGSSAVTSLRDDFMATFKVSQLITYEEWKKIKKKEGLEWPFLRLLAPLL